MTVVPKLNFTEDELVQLHLFTLRDLEASRVELRHTASSANREYIKRRLVLAEALLKKLESALTTRPTDEGGL